MELCSTLPAQLQVVQLALLMKPSGGWRPIDLFCSINRLWGRCRRSYALQWELQYQRSFYAGQSFASASDVVWRQSFRALTSDSSGKASATLLWDMAKFYE
eukprot:8104036-Pyramimonas_sp.AAC.1